MIFGGDPGPGVLSVPLHDPEADMPTTSEQVEHALKDADVAAAEAQLAWRRLQDALQSNRGLDQAARRFEIAVADSRYRWSVYHSANIDAGHAHAA